MSNIELFRLQGDDQVTELRPSHATMERNLQALIEKQMETFLGVRFLASEYATGKTHRGRIDSLGLDENNCPVIVEYKRNIKENVINQGLCYLDWLLDHKAEVRWLIMEKLGKDIANEVEWDGTRLICIAADFTRYDQHAVQQIPRNIELIRYRLFGDDLLLLELINTQTVQESHKQHGHKSEPAIPTGNPDPEGTQTYNTTDENNPDDPPSNSTWSFSSQLHKAPNSLQELVEHVRQFIESLGDDVSEKETKLYLAFRRLKNFGSITIRNQKHRLRLNLKLDPDELKSEFPDLFASSFLQDVRRVGHWGTGDTEVAIHTISDLERAKPLIERAYREG